MSFYKIFIICFCFLSLPFAHALDPQSRISTTSPPEWVVPVSFSTGEKEGGDLAYLLIDWQGHSIESALYVHHAMEYLTRKGVQKEGEITISFDPSYQTVELHTIRIYRKGEMIDQLPTCQTKLTQPDVLSNHFIYTNEYTLTLFLDDIRPGDILEYAYTRKGQISAFQPYVDAQLPSAFNEYADKIHYRVLAGRQTQVYWQTDLGNTEPWIQEIGEDLQEWRWEFEKVQPIEMDPYQPQWFSLAPPIQVSSYANWREAADVFQSLFFRPLQNETVLIDFIESLQRQYPEEKEQLLAAIRFVQDDIRYLSLDLEGGGGCIPHDPSEVFIRRYGDCKDKTRLLVTLCDLLGIEAHPALVSTTMGKRVGEGLPGNLFNHAIVYLNFQGETYFIDPTWASQGGALDQICFPPFSYALILDGKSEHLFPIPIERFHGKLIKERTYKIDPREQRANMNIRVTALGYFADSFRKSFEGLSGEDIQKFGEEKYRNFYEEIETVQVPKICDDRDKNIYTIDYFYRMEEMGEKSEENLSIELFPLSIDQILPPKFSKSRKSPLSLPFPFAIEESVYIELDSGKFRELAEKHFEWEDDSIQCSIDWEKTGEDQLIIRSICKTLKDTVEVEDLKGFLEFLKSLRPYLSISLTTELE